MHFLTAVKLVFTLITAYHEAGDLTTHQCIFLLERLRTFTERYCEQHEVRSFQLYHRLRFQDLTEHETKNWFRFEKGDIPIVCAELRLPEVIFTRSGYRFTDREALLVLLWRISYDNFGHLLDLPAYYRDPARLSDVHLQMPCMQRAAQCLTLRGLLMELCVGRADKPRGRKKAREAFSFSLLVCRIILTIGHSG